MSETPTTKAPGRRTDPILSGAALLGLPARTPWAGGVTALAFLLTPAVAYGGPLGFAILPAAAALLLAPLWARRRPSHAVLFIVAALWIWAAASFAWSPAATAEAAADVETLTPLKLVFVLLSGGLFASAASHLSGSAARRALWAMAAVFTAYAAVLSVEPFLGTPLYHWFSRTLAEPVRPDIARVHLGQGTVALALVAWPLALSLRSARFGAPMTLVILLGAVLAPISLGQQSALLALVAGGAIFGLCARLGPVAIRTAGALAAGAVLAAPWLVLALNRGGVLTGVQAATPASTDARLDIWSLVAERIAQQPLRGWGLDASRLLPPPVSLHPHNGPLQIWFELGAHGAVLTALIWWALFDILARAARADRAGAAAGAAAATAYFIIGALSFGVWQEWWLGLGAVAAAVCAALLVQRRWERMARPPDDARLRDGGLRPL